MTTTTPIAVHGAAGRMGQAILRTMIGRGDVALVAALVRSGSDLEGQPLAATLGSRAPAIVCTSSLPADLTPAVLIDFSVAAAFDHALGLALERRIAFVSGTTGLSAKQQAALDGAAASIAVLWSANFSLGVALLSRLVAEAARSLPDWDCEIAEAHHSRKQDAPSGTALALGREAASARDRDFDAVARLSHVGVNAARTPGSIGFAVTRAGDIVGEHTVTFATLGERIELVHRATDRDIFARGAIVAARWIAGRPHGRYALADVLAGRNGPAIGA
ncbi:4-hydroxy-tetrahydrodipicolinate reductase [Dokdonella soli]|uniref:4-hydroxy-tetrahydrodipicolinate reductase n=1 Tax=Dokdonella soli TaxID=529810 RepID=A0ABN1IBH1_9GAMM